MARDFSKKFTDSYIHGIKPTDKEQLFSDRDKARIWCGLLAQGIDPAEEECMQQEEKEKKSVTFKELAMLWRDKRLKKGELKENSIEKVYRSVELYLFDRFNFSRLLAKNINLRSFDDALLPIEGTGMCDKLCIAIKQIFDNAIDEGVLENNPFTRLSKRFKKPITKNFPSIPPKELMAF